MMGYLEPIVEVGASGSSMDLPTGGAGSQFYNGSTSPFRVTRGDLTLAIIPPKGSMTIGTDALGRETYDVKGAEQSSLFGEIAAGIGIAALLLVALLLGIYADAIFQTFGR